MNVTLQVNGRERTFSKEELKFILEKYFSNEDTKPDYKTVEVAKTPTEGKWFEVKPKTIDLKLFIEEREL